MRKRNEKPFATRHGIYRFLFCWGITAALLAVICLTALPQQTLSTQAETDAAVSDTDSAADSADKTESAADSDSAAESAETTESADTPDTSLQAVSDHSDTASNLTSAANQITGSLLEAGTPVVYYNQKESPWAAASYGTDLIGGYGCGPTACAILISTLTGETVTPTQMADWSVQNGCYITGGGSYHLLLPLACRAYGLQVNGYAADETDAVLQAMEQGALVGVIMGPGHFTSTGHFIILHGLTDDGEFLVADPASRENSEQSWDPEVIFSEAKSYASGGGPYWVVQAAD